MYAKLSGSRCQYGVGVVKTLCDVRTYEVQFEDGTICGDLSINDIIGRYNQYTYHAKNVHCSTWCICIIAPP